MPMNANFTTIGHLNLGQMSLAEFRKLVNVSVNQKFIANQTVEKPINYSNFLITIKHPLILKTLNK